MDIIYLITDSITNLKYIGSKKNWKGPNTYWGSLRCKCKKRIKYEMQQEWKRSFEERPETFIFEVLESYDKIDHIELLKLELQYQKKFNVVKSLEYVNAGFAKKGFLGDTWSVLTDKAKEEKSKQISETLKKRYSLLNKEEKRKRFARLGRENGNFNNRWNEEQKTIASELVKKRWMSLTNEEKKERSTKSVDGLKRFINKMNDEEKNVFYAKHKEKNPFFGKHHSEETIEKMRKKKPNFKSSNMRKVEIEGVVYESLSKVFKTLGISPALTRYRIKSKNEKFKNYKYCDDKGSTSYIQQSSLKQQVKKWLKVNEIENCTMTTTRKDKNRIILHIPEEYIDNFLLKYPFIELQYGIGCLTKQSNNVLHLNLKKNE